ncbi:DUF3310 domain-containing protein [Komagataeibacter melaceti]|uniref:DUF3310 domain-containing protein n=1 Tax=Komagataeibacter melaceti TaxID=2766577 RepID=UPI0011E59506|nr:DUF3310 domain-containing protein [Komagataeibacter melaceti]
MTETHTPYQRGRRAAERGAPRVVPDDIHKAHTGKDDWYRGWDSTKGTAATRGAHYQAGQFQAWDVTRYLSGDMAQAWQYVYRCGRKGSEQDAVTDLRKAVDFIEDWIAHQDIPPSGNRMPHRLIEHLDIETAHILAGVCAWKRPILRQIFWADIVGDEVSGEQDARCRMHEVVIPLIHDEITRREAA